MVQPKTDCFAYAGVRKCLALKEMECLRGACCFYKTEQEMEQGLERSQARLQRLNNYYYIKDKYKTGTRNGR